MDKKKLAEVGLLFSALFWGASGVLTQVVLLDISPMMLIFIRFLIAAILGVALFKINPFKISKELYKHGFNLSLLLMVIYISSTYGLAFTSASNAGFIIGSAVILVPIINRMFFKGSVSKSDIVSSIICLIGLGLVTLNGANKINKGDLFCFIDAIAYSLYIIYNSRLSKKINIKTLSTVQYVFVTIFTLGYCLILEVFPKIISGRAILSLIVLGVFCTFFAFLIQITSQRYTTAEKTGRILTFIPIFTVMFDLLFFNAILTVPAAIGGLLIILSTLSIDSNINDKFKLFSAKLKRLVG